MRLKIGECEPRRSAGLGASLAEQHLRPLARAIADGSLNPGSMIQLDFSGIEAINGSYIKGTLLWLLTCGQMSTKPSERVFPAKNPSDPRPYDLYVCASGLKPHLLEEFQEFFKPRGLPLLHAYRFKGELIEEGRLIGHLDPVLAQTLMLLCKAGRTTAPKLFQANSEQGVTVTAWNNRLNDLNSLRLVKRYRAGRSWEYESIAQQIVWE